MSEHLANILIVDDTPANLQYLAALLGGRGYKVRPAINGEMALQAVKASAPDLILLDVMMPELSGYDVCARLQADPASRAIPVIFISSLDAVDDKVAGFRAGGVDYVVKPFQAEEVLARIKVQLDLRRMRVALEVANDQLNVEVAKRTRAQIDLQRHQDILEEAVAERTAELQTLVDAARAVSSSLDLNTLAGRIAELMGQASGSDACALYRPGRRGERLVAWTSWRRDGPTAEPPALDGLSASLAQRVLVDLEPVLLGTGTTPPELPSARAFGVERILLLPLKTRTYGTGLAALASFHRPEAYPPTVVRLCQTLVDQAAVGIENALLFAQSERHVRRLEALRQVDIAINASLDLAQTLQVLLTQATTHLHVDAANVLLVDGATRALTLAASRGFRAPQTAHPDLCLDGGFAQRAATQRRSLHIPDLTQRTTTFLRTPLYAAEGFVSYYAVPLLAQEEVVGVLEIFHRSSLEVDDDWVSFLDALAGQAATALMNAQLFDALQKSHTELSQAYDSTLEGWARALELRDGDTAGHARRVTDLTERLARAMGQTDLRSIRYGSILHDVGKLSVPDRILLKPGQLTDDEWVIMKRHPEHALEMLHHIHHLRPALEIPYCHHEKWDGSGYPRGLKEAEIPLAARIFAVVDVWDALTSDRPYRRAWDRGRVLAYIRDQAGTHFDPVVVQAFIQMMAAER